MSAAFKPPSTEEVEDFLSRPAVVDAQASPRSVRSVLNFWFGSDTSDGVVLESLSTSETVMPILLLWFMGGELFDKGCQPFAEVIRELKTGSLTEEEWGTTEGKVARLLLADQMSRNVFRGSSEAYEYDGVALELSKGLSSGATLSETMKLPAIQIFFVCMPLQHSEDLADHDAEAALNQAAAELHPEFKPLKLAQVPIKEHRDVLVQFGRYPHRNKLLGRENTPEEETWLDSAERRAMAWTK